MSEMEVMQDSILNIQRQLWNTSMDYWLKYVVNSWQWWLNIALLVLPLIAWWLLVDKKRIFEIVAYGFIASSFAVFLDTIGETTILWEYPYLVIPMDYILIDADYSILPVAFMLAFQYTSTWKGFIAANIAVSGIFSFVAEPLLVLLGLYEIHGWKYIYSFPIYAIIAIISKWIIDVFRKKQDAAQQ